MKTLKNIIKRCEVCQKNNPKTGKLAKSGLQRRGKYPGEDWEIDLTHMPKANGYSCLQVCVDTFIVWIEAFPCRSEQAKEVIKILIHEIIPRLGLPWSLQSDNGSAFKAAVTRGVLFLPPSDAYVRSFLYLLYTLIKLYFTKALSDQVSSLAPD